MSLPIVKHGLSYDPATGVFVRVDPPHNNQRLIGKRAGSLTSNGYWNIRLNGRLWRAHRLAWLFVHGAEPTDQIDHINGIRDDNRIANLRLATNTENGRNRVVSKNNKIGLKGVCRKSLGERFTATIWVNGKNRHLGYFHTAEAAAAAYDLAAAKYHGEFAKYNAVDAARAARGDQG